MNTLDSDYDPVSSGDVFMKVMMDEIQSLRAELIKLKGSKEDSRKAPKISIADLYETEEYQDQKYNVAAMTIILHKKSAKEWQLADLGDSPVILERINDEKHYLLHAKGKERVLNKDGSYCSSYLLILRFNHFFIYSILSDHHNYFQKILSFR